MPCIIVWQIWTQLDNFKGKRKDDELPVESRDESSAPIIKIHNHNINLNANVASAEAELQRGEVTNRKRIHFTKLFFSDYKQRKPAFRWIIR